MFERKSCVFFVAALLAFCAISQAWAAGGVYIGGIKATNDGAVVFSENFKNDGLKGWTNIIDTTVVSNKEGACILMNEHKAVQANISHPVSVKNGGVFEVNAYVYLTPATEQSIHVGRSGCHFDVIIKSGASTVRGYAYLNWNETASHVGCSDDKASIGRITSDHILEHSKWFKLTLKLNPSDKQAHIYIDGVQKSDWQYKPEDFRNIDEVYFTTNFGDGGSVESKKTK